MKMAGDYIPKPLLTDDGCWDPTRILEYIDTCTANGQSVRTIAKALRVSVDRVQYAMGPGRYMFERRAEQERWRRSARQPTRERRAHSY